MAKNVLAAVTLLSTLVVTVISVEAQSLTQSSLEGYEGPNIEKLPKEEAISGTPKSTREWLDSAPTRIHVRRTNDAIIYYSGFVRSDKLNKQVIDLLNENSLEVGYPSDDERAKELMPIEFVELAASQHRLNDCTMLIQTAKIANANNPDPRTEHLLTALRNKLPRHPLGKNCEELDPWKGLEQSWEELIEVNGSKAIYHQGHLTVIDPNLRCSQFAEERSGSLEITPHTKAIVRSYSNRMPTHVRDSYRTSRIATIFESGLKQGLTQAGQPKIQMLANDYLADAPGVIRIDYSIIDDDAADIFCFVSSIKQGDASRADIMSIPREGLKAEWTDFLDRRPAWKGLRESRDFGRRVGVGLANKPTR